MPWDIINMTSTYLSVQATTTNQTACQAACSADLKCQYYVWYNYTVSGNGDDQCYLRLATANITKISGFDSATSTDIILFEVRCALEGRMAGNASAFPPRARLSLPTRTPSWCSSLPPQRALTPIHHPQSLQNPGQAGPVRCVRRQGPRRRCHRQHADRRCHGLCHRQDLL